MTTKTTAEQIQDGIDARVDQPILNAAEQLTLATRSVLGHDGTTVDDAVTAATRPGGPHPDILRKRIEWRRAHPNRLNPPTAA